MQAPNYINMMYDLLDQFLLGGTQWGWEDNWDSLRRVRPCASLL